MLLRSIVDQPNNPILYSTVSKLDVVYGKLNEFLKEEGIVLEEGQKSVLDQSKKMLENQTKTLDTNAWIFFVGNRMVWIKEGHFILLFS